MEIEGPPPVKPIRLSAHARGYLDRRGCSEAEIVETIQSEIWHPARLGRSQAEKDFPYGQVWNGHRYAVKRVRPVFVEEDTEIVVVTVYTYFF